MWKAIAAQAEHGEFGNPDVFCSNIDATNWMSATVATSNEEIRKNNKNILSRIGRKSEGKMGLSDGVWECGKPKRFSIISMPQSEGEKGEVTFSLRPVSYTPLDVYKRKL